jgi:hypothetical protein
MTTTLPRHTVTEVPPLASALATARVAWPDETSVSQLIVKLAALGEAKLKEDPDLDHQARLAKAKALAGKYPSRLGPHYLDSLRAEWGE